MGILTFLKNLSWRQWAVAAAVLVVTTMAGMISYERHMRRLAELGEREAQLQTVNVVAKNHATVIIRGDSIKALGDSLTLFRRQIVQEKQKSGRLDHALGEYAVANYDLTLMLDTAKAKAAAPVTETPDSLRATFHVDQAPYHATADVALPKLITPPAQGRLNLSITSDPLHFHASVTCGAASDRGVRTASLNVTTAGKFTAVLDSLSQDESICSPIPKALLPSGYGMLKRARDGALLLALTEGLRLMLTGKP